MADPREHLTTRERKRFDRLTRRRTRIMREAAAYRAHLKNLRDRLVTCRKQLAELDSRGRTRERYARLGKEDRYSRAGHSMSGRLDHRDEESAC